MNMTAVIPVILIPTTTAPLAKVTPATFTLL